MWILKWLPDFVTMTKKINGGELGLPERIAQCNHALQVLNT